jgi:hypothetical protein
LAKKDIRAKMKQKELEGNNKMNPHAATVLNADIP